MKQPLMGVICLLPAFAFSTAIAAGDPVEGRIKSETCLGCHGVASYNNVYPTYHVPRLTGQHAEYLVSALKSYRSGQRIHSTMQIQAESMTDQDMADIAAYWSRTGSSAGSGYSK